MRKYLKYILIVLLTALVGYKSVYIEKLSTRKKDVKEKFNAQEFTSALWNSSFTQRVDSAISMPILIKGISQSPEQAFEKFTNSLAVGNYRYALIKVEGTVQQVKDDDVIIKTSIGDSTFSMVVATEFIYGNAIRDASKLVQVRDFPNTNDLNAISEEMNKTVRLTVIPQFKKTVKEGQHIEVVGAIEINKEHVHWQGLEILPVKITMLP